MSVNCKSETDVVFSSVAASSISIPLASFMDSNNSVMMNVGFFLPASSGAAVLSSAGYFSSPIWGNKSIHGLAENLAKKILEPNGQTITGRWMDATKEFVDVYPEGFKRGGWHRVFHGHSFDNILEVYKNPNLKVSEFLGHQVTDVVTRNGIPVVPFSKDIAQGVMEIARGLGYDLPQSVIAPYLSFNIFDLGASYFSVQHAGQNLTSVINGSAEWNFSYAFDTLGVGSLEIASGVATSNPFLIGSGVVDAGCGAYTYFTTPSILGVSINEVIYSAELSALMSLVITGASLCGRNKELTKEQKFAVVIKNTSRAAALSAISAVSIPTSLLTSTSYAVGKYAYDLAAKDYEYINGVPIVSDFSAKSSSSRVSNSASAAEFEQYIRRKNRYAENRKS